MSRPSDAGENWVAIQQRTFMKWCNNHLAKKGRPLIHNSETDFDTGILLMNLINALYPHIPIPKHNPSPKLRPHKLDNISLALKMIDDANIKTNFLKSTHLIDHDLKMILGMQWAIILDYAIKGINVEELTAKEGLLLWVKKQTAGYKYIDPPGVNNFTKDFRTGLIFCALIHRHRPDLIDYDHLSPDTMAENVELAFSIAEKDFGIPRLLEVNDVIIDKPDERSIITYVSEYFHHFSTMGKKNLAARRTIKFLSLLKKINELKHNYEKEASALLQWINEQSLYFSSLSKIEEGQLEEAIKAYGELKHFLLHIQPLKAALKLDIESLFIDIQSLLKINNRPHYYPPSHLSPDLIDNKWSDLLKIQQSYAKVVREIRFHYAKKDDNNNNGNLTEDKLIEYRESFNYFDSNKDDSLDRTEFKAALSAIGIDYKEDEFNKIFNNLSENSNNNNGGINSDQYIAFLIELHKDKDSPDQLKEAFKILADDAPFIRPDQLLVGEINQDDINFLTTIMPVGGPDENHFDYNAFVDANFVSK